MKDLRHALILVVIGGLTASIGGCRRDPPVPPPEIVSFAASPAEVESGGTTTLSWETRHAVAVSITDSGGEVVNLGDAPAELGSVDLSLDESRTFVLIAVGAEGTEPVEASLSVLVSAPAVPQIAAFMADPEVSVAGEPVVLSWETSGAEWVVIVDDAGAAVDLGEEEAAAGQVVVAPWVDTEYTLTATGPGGEAEATLSVTVLSAGNIVRFEADADGPVLPGSTVTLSWETIDATQITLLAGDTVLLSSDSELSGDLEVTVEATTRFILEAEGAAGLGALAVTVEVLPLIQSFTASPLEVRAGETLTFSWAVRGATEAEITGPEGFAHVIAAGDVAEGLTAVTASSTGTYVLTAHSGDLSSASSAAVLVTERPIIRAFSVDPGIITRTEPATVSWTLDGADSAVLLADPGEPIVLQGADLVSGSRTFFPATSTTYTLRAENTEGMSEASRVLPAHPIPQISTFHAIPARVASGEEMTLSWSTVDAVAVRLFKDGIDLQIDPEAVVGQHADVVLVDAVYTLRAQNVLGYEVSADVHVTVGSPVVTRFEVMPDAIHPGETVVFVWAAEGGETLEIRDPAGEIVCTATGVATVAEGSCEHPGLLDGLYTLEVTNDDGATEAQTRLMVTEGPVVRSFTASPATVSVDELVMLSWTVDGPVGGGSHTLVLEDGDGTPLDLGGADIHDGAIALFPAEAGTYPFTLTATSGTLSHARTVSIEAAAQPVIHAFAADPERLNTEGGTASPTAELSWATENASEIVVWQMDDAGVPLLPALFESADPSEVAAGTLEVAPSRNAFYRLIARNALGASVQQDRVIWVDLPSIDDFRATRTLDGTTGKEINILSGEEIALVWETEFADRVDLHPVDPEVTEYGAGQAPQHGGYVDLSARPTAEEVILSTSAVNGRAIIDFPGAFAFPYYGMTYGSAEVTSRGYLTFEAGQSYAPTTSYPLGTGDDRTRNSMIAPFWEYLDVGVGSPEIWYELLDEGGEDVLAIQWKGWNFHHSDKRTANLNFMVKLRESGVIEFHYGNMSNSDPDRQHFADGSKAAIGFQNHNRRFGYLWRFHEAEPDPLSNTSVVFDFGRPAQGSVGYVIDPLISLEDERTTQFVLVASNESGRESDVVNVTRWRDIDVLGVNDFRLDISAAEVEVGDAVTLTWLAVDATEAEIYESDAPVAGCSAQGTLSAHGTCQVILDEGRDYAFELHASNPVSSGVRVQPAIAFDVLRIEVFDVTEQHLEGGQNVTLFWEIQGASSAEIDVETHSGATSTISVDASELEEGDRLLTPAETTHYTLRITDSETGRVRTASTSVYVDAARITDASADTTQVRAGETVNLSWTTTNAETISLYPANPAEVDADFVDIRPTGTRITEWTGSDTNDNKSAFLNLPFDFAFPFDGQDRYAFTISVNGYITLEHSGGTVSTPRAVLPSAGSPTALFAPFWANLVRDSTGEVHYQVIPGATSEEDQLIVQWSEMQFATSSWNPSSLTFQAVLFGDGNAEFRYATMEGDAQERADGRGATIGWQNFAGDRGGMIDKLQDQRVPDGLSDRTWRVPSGYVSDGFPVMPSRTTDYEVCVSGNGWTECETLTVVVVEAGHVMFSELMIDVPSIADGMGEWFEVRNTTVDPIDIQGWVVLGGFGLFKVPEGEPVVLAPGEFAVFARGDGTVNGGFEPDHVYGPGFPLNPEQDQLTLYYDALIVDRVAWDVNDGWTLAPDQSLTLDGSRLRGCPVSGCSDDDGPADNRTPSAWCEPLESYAPGLFGSPGTLGRGCFHDDYDVDTLGASWIEISDTGSRLDRLVGTTFTRVQEVPGGLGFAMPFFDQFVSGVWVTNKGVLSFDSLTSVSTFPPAIPSTNNPDNLVAPFWTNLRENGDGSAVYWDRRTIDDTQVAIVQWQNFQHSTNPGVLTFQVQMWETGDVAVVMGENRSTGSSESARDLFAGSSATVGIENHDGTDGVQYSRNEAILGRHTRLLFRRDPL